MKSRNWPRRFALVCATSLLAGRLVYAQPAEQRKVPAIAVFNESEAEKWRPLIAPLGWQVIVPPEDPDANPDRRVQGLAMAVGETIKAGTVDPNRIYIAGRGDMSPMVFYAIARVPDRWTAGIALGGSPKFAIDSNRVFAANFTNTPVLWASAGAADGELAIKLKDAGMNVQWRSSAELTNQAVVDWLNSQVRADFPLNLDCETNSPTFASCYWVQLTKFDAAERNDVLPMTLIPGDLGANLDLGGFSYRSDDPGPGVGVAFVPEKYNGPLKVGDRLVSLDGKPIDNAKHFISMLQKVEESRNAVVMIQRAKERIRLETRILVPRRDPVVTARVTAEYSPEGHQITLISRSVIEMRVTIPADWLPAELVWNGLTLESLKTAGCYALKIEKELLHAGPCQ